LGIVGGLIGTCHTLDGLENVQFVVGAIHCLVHGSIVLGLLGRSLLTSDETLEKIG